MVGAPSRLVGRAALPRRSQAEALDERLEIAHVLGSVLVAGVADRLDLGRQAADLVAAHTAASREPCGRVRPRRPVPHLVDAVPVLVEDDGVDVDLAPLGVEATRIEGLTGIWLESPPRKIASIGIHISKWVTTHGYALNVDLDPSPFTEWITACGLEDTAFTTIARELGRPVGVDEVRPHAVSALERVFGLELVEASRDALPPRPVQADLAGTA